jgi:arylsulfatase A
LRRQVMRALTRHFCFALALACAQGGLAADGAARPNFVIVMADDLGYGDLGVYGSTLIKTPNLDRMALEGARFDSFYSSANICTAARGGLLTGRYPIRLDLVNDVARPTNEVHLAPDEITIAEALKPLGYRTGLFGKWHLGSRVEWGPLQSGFDRVFGVLHSNDMSPLELYDQDAMIEDPVVQETLTQRYTEQALTFIEDSVEQEQPFLVYLPHSFPHVPLHTTAPFEGQSDAGLYGDVVETIDWSMGQLLAKLESLGIDDNTLVIFTSDNGPWWEGSPGPFRDRKGSSWEGGQRVPFIAQWPGKIPRGLVSNEPAMNIDLFPTLLALAGGELPSDREIDGLNISEMLFANASSPHEALFLFDADRIAGVRSGQWKLVLESRYRNVTNSFDNPDSYYGPVGLLFDVVKDPSETYSFAREQPEIVEQMRAHLERGQNTLNSTLLPNMWNR